MTRKFLVLSLLLSAFLLNISVATFAAGAETEEGKEDPTGFIMHHIKDSHEWHFFNVGHTHITLPLPVITYSSDRGLEFYSSTNFQNPETHKFGKEYAHNGIYIDEHEHLGRVEGGSIIDFSIYSIVTGGLLIPNTQAASHGAGQIRPVNSGKLLVEWRRSIASLSSPRQVRSFHSGMRLPNGQPW